MGKPGGLTIAQIVLPTLPLILLIAFDLTYRPVSNWRTEVRNLRLTVRSRTGELVERRVVRRRVPVFHIHWQLGPLAVARESVVVLAPGKAGEWLPEQVDEARSRSQLLVFLATFAVSAMLAYGCGWHARLSSDAPWVSPLNVLVVSGGVIVMLAAAASFARGWLDSEINEVAQVFTNSKNWGWAAVVTFLVAPVSEELVFRVFLQRLLNRWTPAIAALMIQAGCFAVCHPTNLLHMLIGFFGGLSFGVIYLVTNRIWVPIAAHAMANLVFVLLVL